MITIKCKTCGKDVMSTSIDGIALRQWECGDCHKANKSKMSYSDLVNAFCTQTPIEGYIVMRIHQDFVTPLDVDTYPAMEGAQVFIQRIIDVDDRKVVATCELRKI